MHQHTPKTTKTNQQEQQHTPKTNSNMHATPKAGLASHLLTPKSNSSSNPHTPMSERQQMALIRHMEEEGRGQCLYHHSNGHLNRHNKTVSVFVLLYVCVFVLQPLDKHGASAPSPIAKGGNPKLACFQVQGKVVRNPSAGHPDKLTKVIFHI